MRGWRHISKGLIKFPNFSEPINDSARAERVQQILAQTEVMVNAGQCLDAIEYMTVQNERLGDPDLEQALIVLRRRAFLALEKSAGRSDWPPAADNLFPDIQGPPEVDKNNLTAEHLASALHITVA